MTEKADVWQGTLALMVLKTLETLGPLHGYGVARRIEQTSGDLLAVRYGTLYPALIKLEQEGYISATWGVSDNNRRAKYYALTRAGRKRLESEARDWDRTTAIIARFFTPSGEGFMRAIRAFLFRLALQHGLRNRSRRSGGVHSIPQPLVQRAWIRLRRCVTSRETS